ncbi:HAD family hydrolase [Paenibacillus sp. GCM10012307]|uniref:HAD family hydrolase n=1 Tax=Paenibacillus roseus TaxID=2798579 RepID=A0A934IZJ9_9BACL|nr:HAD family hydrolase [Paenibacillus roseus]MBJ6359955.1 HAD family hydrolase [Paenibacillus roseus]
MNTHRKSERGIIFDMDNTLLQSTIDFQAMKRDLLAMLILHGIVKEDFPAQHHTSSMLLDYARQQGITSELERELLASIARHEYDGMQGVGLEPGATALLTALYGDYTLVLVTNNALVAAESALHSTGIHSCFDLIIGRDQMEALKPSPSAYLLVKLHFPRIADQNWISVGDSWIDGRASLDAGVPFVTYKTTAAEMKERGVVPTAAIRQLSELPAIIQALMEGANDGC